MAVIEDGAGRGFTARVNSENRLYTFADSVPSGAVAASRGKMWGISTGDLTFTNDSTSAIAYLRYSGLEKLVVSRVGYTTGASDGTGNTTYRIIKNPTTGTIVDNAIAANTTNRNFSGTSSSLSGVQYSGADGYTLTNGVVVGDLNRESAGLFILEANESPYILENGNSFGVTVTPPTGNTSQTNRLFIVAYELVV